MATKKTKSLPPFLTTLATTIAVSIGIFVIRSIWSNDFYFAFLLWNLFLALIPLGISQTLKLRSIPLQSKTAVLLLVLWLLFFPNAPYLITDLFHLFERGGVPPWLDLFMLFSFAWNGLCSTYLSLRDIEQWLGTRLTKEQTRSLRISLLILTSFGLYLGRYLRFNSWDALTQPLSIVQNVFSAFSTPSNFADLIVFTIVSTILLLTSIEFLEKISPEKKPARRRNTV
jgi:uncharacterized membrane protein